MTVVNANASVIHFPSHVCLPLPNNIFGKGFFCVNFNQWIQKKYNDLILLGFKAK